MAALRARSAAAAFAAIAAVGATMTPVMPLSFELSAECTYPMAEAVPTGLLMSGGQLVGVAATLFEGALVDDGQAMLANGVNAAACGVGLVATLLFRGRLLRLEADRATAALASAEDADSAADAK